MNYTPLYLLILAHVGADFPLQIQGLAKRKLHQMKFLWLHGAIVLFFSFLLLLPFLSLRGLIGLTLLFLAHTLIDYLRIKVSRAYDKKYNLELGIIDQLLHILTIICVWAFSYSDALLGRGLMDFPIDTLNKGILYSAGYIFIFKGGTEVVRGLLDKIRERVPPKELQVGRIIGNLERVIILTLVLVNQFTAIAFVLTAKTITRFKELENKIFAEYYLVGALASFTVAVLVGLIIKGVT